VEPRIAVPWEHQRHIRSRESIERQQSLVAVLCEGPRQHAWSNPSNGCVDRDERITGELQALVLKSESRAAGSVPRDVDDPWPTRHVKDLVVSEGADFVHGL
jgi:hypothetical protein